MRANAHTMPRRKRGGSINSPEERKKTYHSRYTLLPKRKVPHETHEHHRSTRLLASATARHILLAAVILVVAAGAPREVVREVAEEQPVGCRAQNGRQESQGRFLQAEVRLQKMRDSCGHGCDFDPWSFGEAVPDQSCFVKLSSGPAIFFFLSLFQS